MKTLYLLVSLSFFTILHATGTHAANELHILREKLVRYDFELENTIKLAAKSGQSAFVKPSDLAQLQGLKIHHVDIVYSAYTGSNSYSQDYLNGQRIANLKILVPQVATDKPTWKYIEQTGPRSLNEAKTYFHGFILHYGPDLTYQHLKAFFEPWQTPAKKFIVNAKTGGVFDCSNGSTIKIESNAVTYADGTPVNGDFTLEYKEFKYPADFAFSGIPMTYNEGNEDLNFSSVGMYDLRAEQNGKTLALSSPAKVDFNCTEPADGVAFYQMNDATGEWTKQKDVNYGSSNKTLKYTRKSELYFDGKHYEFNWEVFSAYSTIQFDETSWDWFFKHIATHPNLKALVQEFDEIKKSAQTSAEPKDFMDLVSKIMIEEKKEELKQARAEREEIERKRREKAAAKLAKIRAENARIAKEAAAARIFSNSLVSGLSSPNFGVYNCDQVYRLEQPLALSPTYVDENGTEITSKHVVCVMDLNFNGSFTFHPNNIKCSGVGKNYILLFTNDKNVFMFTAEEFDQLELSENLRPVFRMKNMTSVIQTSDDLKAYLQM